MFIALGMTTDLLGSEMVREYWGWTALPPEDPLIQAVAFAWAYGLGVIAVYLCLLHFLKVSDEKRKQQAKFVFIGFSVVLVSGLVTNWLLPLLGTAVPEAMSIAFTMACVCGGYAMWKYDLFAITPTAAADAIISTMPDALLLVGPDGRIALANRATLKMLGYSEDELVGQSIQSVLTGDSAEMALAGAGIVRRAPADGGRVETGFTTKAGGRIPVQLSASVMVDRHGRLCGTIYIGRDITELKLAEEEKLRMEHQLQIAGRLAAVGELSAGVAHELNNPLAAIQAFAQYLASRENLDSTTKRDVETIYREAQRASRITGNLLSFARRSQPEKHFMSINGVVEKSVHLYAYSMKASNIEVRMELDPDLPETLADADQMHQVFVNIVKNAEEAMAAGRGRGVLSVKTQRAGDFIQITFADDGPGISEADLENVFDPFFTTKEVGKGTGLGLSICYGIIENHGGRIRAWSNPGEGAVFVVEIPVVDGTGPDAGETGLSSAAADGPPH
jgi:PAS domain S-box-containing protein